MLKNSDNGFNEAQLTEHKYQKAKELLHVMNNELVFLILSLKLLNSGICAFCNAKNLFNKGSVISRSDVNNHDLNGHFLLAKILMRI